VAFQKEFYYNNGLFMVAEKCLSIVFGITPKEAK